MNYFFNLVVDSNIGGFGFVHFEGLVGDEVNDKLDIMIPFLINKVIESDQPLGMLHWSYSDSQVLSKTLWDAQKVFARALEELNIMVEL